jgi:hypothetical protein
LGSIDFGKFSKKQMERNFLKSEALKARGYIDSILVHSFMHIYIAMNHEAEIVSQKEKHYERFVREG